MVTLKHFAIIVFCLSFNLAANGQDNEWKDLFNGENLDGWIVKISKHEVGDNYANTFRAEDGVIKVRYDEYEGAFDNQFGHMFYEVPYFALSLVNGIPRGG